MSDKRKEIWEALDAGLRKWMSKAYATGQSDERERIIQLLEELFNKAENAETRRLLTMAIALIKGESNGNV